MAVRFDAATDGLLRTANQPAAEGPWTITFWFHPLSTTGFQTLCYIGDDSFNQYHSIYLNGTTLTLDIRGTTDNWATAVSANTWYFCGMVRGVVANRTDVYMDGSGTADPQVTQTALANTRWEYGASTTSNTDPFSGRIAGVKFWSQTLTVAEIDQERQTFRPHRFADLEGFYPCIQAAAADNVEDWSGLGRNFTADGTLTVEDGPPIGYGGFPIFISTVAAAAPEVPFGWPPTYPSMISRKFFGVASGQLPGRSGDV